MRMRWLVTIILLLFTSAGCDFGPLDDASARAVKENQNQYFYYDTRPQYYLVLYNIKNYAPEQKDHYFFESLAPARQLARNLGKIPRRAVVQYIVFIIFDLSKNEPPKADFEAAHCAAKIFRVKDVADAADLAQLIAAIPDEQRPYAYWPPKGMTSGGPIIDRHMAAHFPQTQPSSNPTTAPTESAKQIFQQTTQKEGMRRGLRQGSSRKENAM